MKSWRCENCAAYVSQPLRALGLDLCPICLRALPSSKPKWKPKSKKPHMIALTTPFDSFLESEPGNPLGKGMPSGSPLREDGESHREAWMRIIRCDPCAFCGEPAGTVDHIEPQSKPSRGIGGKHCWVNYTAACERCNGAKADKHLLHWMLARSRNVPRKKRVLPLVA